MRFGFIGAGGATRALHLPALAAVPGATVAGGCDPTLPRARLSPSARARPSSSPRRRCSRPCDPELVVVAAPPAAHEELCVAALAAGAHVLCEKPLAPTVAERRPHPGCRECGRPHRRRAPRLPRAADLPGPARADRVAARRDRFAFCQVWQLVDQPPWAEDGWRGELAARTEPARERYPPGGPAAVPLRRARAGRDRRALRRRDPRARRRRRRPARDRRVPRGPPRALVIDRLARGGDRYLEVRADCEHASLRASWGGRALLRRGQEAGARGRHRLERAAGRHRVGGARAAPQDARPRSRANPPWPGTAELLAPPARCARDGAGATVARRAGAHGARGGRGGLPLGGGGTARGARVGEQRVEPPRRLVPREPRRPPRGARSPSAALRTSSSIRRPSAAASAAASPGGKKQRGVAERLAVRRPMSLRTHGAPHAAASTAGRPNPSASEGDDRRRRPGVEARAGPVGDEARQQHARSRPSGLPRRTSARRPRRRARRERHATSSGGASRRGRAAYASSSVSSPLCGLIPAAKRIRPSRGIESERPRAASTTAARAAARTTGSGASRHDRDARGIERGASASAAARGLGEREQAARGAAAPAPCLSPPEHRGRGVRASTARRELHRRGVVHADDGRWPGRGK